MIFNKVVKNTYQRKESISRKWCCKKWMPICVKMKLKVNKINKYTRIKRHGQSQFLGNHLSHHFLISEPYSPNSPEKEHCSIRGKSLPDFRSTDAFAVLWELNSCQRRNLSESIFVIFLLSLIQFMFLLYTHFRIIYGCLLSNNKSHETSLLCIVILSIVSKATRMYLTQNIFHTPAKLK